MKKITLFLLAFFAGLGQLIALNLNDTVFISLNNGASVQIITPEYSELPEYIQLSSIVIDFQEGLKDIIDEIPPYDQYSIIYHNNKIIFKELENKEEFLMDTSTYIYSINELKNYCKMLPVIPKGCGLHEYFEILIRFSDIQQLKDTNIQHFINKTIQILPEKAKTLKNLFYICNDTTALFDKEESYIGSQGRELELAPGVGIDIIKSEILLNFVLSMSITIIRNDIYQHFIYLSEDFCYVYDDDKDFNINSFINLGYSFNSLQVNKKKLIFGLEAGMLIVRSGTFFEKNTFRLGIGTNSSTIFVKGFVYFPGGINDVYPGISVGGKF